MKLSDRRLRIGRLATYIEWRDLWVGVFVAADAVYVCPLPTLVLRWTRRVQPTINLGRRRLPPMAIWHCDSCGADRSNRHERFCPQIPKDWFTTSTHATGRAA